MKVIYDMEVNQKRSIQVLDLSLVEIEGCRVSFITEGGVIKSVSISVAGMDIIDNLANKTALVEQLIRDDVKEKVYRIACYIANRILIETNTDIIDPNLIFCYSPVLEAENNDEGDYLKTINQIQSNCKIGSLNTRQPVSIELQSYPTCSHNSPIYNYYAEALRTNNPATKYELFYKVVEYFFEKDLKNSVGNVSSYCMPFDGRFDANTIQRLKDTRNRVTHPVAKLGHLNMEKLSDLAIVQKELPIIMDLAKLLIDNPPR